MKDYLEIKFWQLAIYIIRKGYGANCDTKDTDDFPGIEEKARCGSCRAKEVVEWIEDYIELIKMFR